MPATLRASLCAGRMNESIGILMNRAHCAMVPGAMGGRHFDGKAPSIQREARVMAAVARLRS